MVEREPEPDVAPDWRRAPEEGRLGVASTFDVGLGRAIHAALRGWQAAVDAGGPRDPAALVAAVLQAARQARLDPDHLARAEPDLTRELTTYASGPWPALPTLALEHSARHLLRGDGVDVEVAIRVDRVVAYGDGVAVIDFKTVPPHRLQLLTYEWQLQVYALGIDDVLGRPEGPVSLFIIDIRRGVELRVDARRTALTAARRRVLACAGAIVTGDFRLGQAHRARPCWSCGFRLTCPRSLATDPPRALA